MTKRLYLLLFLNLTFVVSWAQCNQVVRQANEQGDRVIIRSTSGSCDWTEPVQYTRVTKKGVTQFYIQLYVLGGSSMNQQGASVFFKDGTVLEWPKAEAEITSNGTTQVSQCQLKLTESEMEQFQEKQIARINLSTYNRSLTTMQSQRAQDIINCVIYADYCAIKFDEHVNQ